MIFFDEGSSIAIDVVQNANTKAITNTTKRFILNPSFSYIKYYLNMTLINDGYTLNTIFPLTMNFH
jgi:hypothetical protein